MSKNQHSEVLKLLSLEDDESFENEEEVSSSKMIAGSNKSIGSRMLTSLFFAVYIATRNTVISVWWGVFVLVYAGLQIFALTLVPDSEVEAVPAFSWVKTQIDYITLRSIADASNSVVEIVFIVVIVVLLITYAMFAWVLKQFWSANKPPSGFLTLAMYFLFQIETTVFFMPIITILTSSINCSTGVIACDGGVGYYILATVIILILVLFVASTCFIILVANENNPLAPNMLASSHGRVEAIVCVISGVLNFANTIADQQFLIVSLVTVTLGSVAICTLYFKYLPFYRPYANRLACGVYSMAAWGILCLWVSYFLGDTTRNIFITCLLMGMPMVLACTVLFIVVRESMTGEREVEKGMSPYTVELILRCKWKDQSWGNKVGEYRKIVDQFYPEDAFMLFHLSIMYGASGSASLLASQYMSKSNRCRNKSIDDRFSIFRAFKRLHEEKHNESGSMNYMTLKHHQMTAETSILEALHQIQILFDTLYGGGLATRDLFLIARRVDRASSRAKENLDMLIKLTKCAPRALLLYSIYASEIMFDFRLSKRLHRAAHVAFRENGMGAQSELDTVTIVISGNEANIGMIMDCSDNMENVYGYTPSNIIGTNVDNLCPPPINNGVHERFLRHYIETAVNFVPVTRTIWIRHNDGYYVRCSMAISPVQDMETGNLVFQGKLTKVQQELDFVGVRPTGEILFYSEGMVRAFGLRSFFDKENNGEVRLQKVIPAMQNVNFETYFEKLAADPSFSEQLVLETGPGESYKFQIYPKSFPQARIKFVVIDLQMIIEEKHSQDMEVTDESDQDAESDVDEEEARDRLHSAASVDEMTKFNRPDDETASAKSEGNSTVRAASRIRANIRVGIEKEKTRLDRFRRFAVIFAITFIALTIVSVVVNHYVFSKMVNNIDTFRLSGDRVNLIVESGATMLTMLNTSSANITLVKTTISQNADAIESIHENILHLSASQTSTISNLHYNSSMAQEYASDHTTSSVSFNSLVLMLVSNMRAFLNNENGVSTCGVTCQFVINNAQWDIVDIAIDMIWEYKLDVESMFVTVQYINLSAIIFSAMIATFVMLDFIMPRLSEVKRVKEDVSYSVGNIQMSVLKRICTYNAQRSHKVSLMITHINKSQNPFQIDMQQLGRDVRMVKAVGGGYTKKALAASSTKPASAFLCCCKKRKPRNQVTPGEAPAQQQKQKSQLKDHGSSKSYIWSFTVMSLPLAAIVLYFGLVFYANNALNSDATLYLNSLNANVLRWLDFERLGFASRVPMDDPPTWSRWYENPSLYNETKEIGNLLVDIESSVNVIEYGNDAGTGKPFIDKTLTPELYSVYYVNSCVDVSECVEQSNLSPDDNMVAWLANGLQVTINSLLEQSQSFLAGLTDQIMTLEGSFSLAAANRLFLSLFEERLILRIDTVQRWMLGLSFAAMFMIAMIFIFLVRVFRGINNELVNAQSLFLLLPADVLDSIPMNQGLAAGGV